MRFDVQKPHTSTHVKIHGAYMMPRSPLRCTRTSSVSMYLCIRVNALYSLYSSICVQMAHTRSAARRRGFGVEGRFKVFVYAFSVVLVASMVTLSILRQVRGSLLCLNFSVVTHIHTAVQIGTNGNDNGMYSNTET